MNDDWPDFTDRLVTALRDVTDWICVVNWSEVTSDRYIRFTGFEDRLVAETTRVQVLLGNGGNGLAFGVGGFDRDRVLQVVEKPSSVGT